MAIPSLRCEKKKKAFSISWVDVLHRSALALTTRCLCTKNGLTHFTSKCCALFLGPLTKTKIGFAISLRSGGVLHLSRWLSPRCACTPTNPFHHGCALQNSFPVQKWSYATARHLNPYPCAFSFAELSISCTGGLLLIALTRHFAISAVSDGGSEQNPICTTSERRYTAQDQSSFSAKISYRPSVEFASQSLMFSLLSPESSNVLLNVFLKTCIPNRFLVLVGVVMFLNSMNLDLINGGRHFGSRFHSFSVLTDSFPFPPFFAVPPFVLLMIHWSQKMMKKMNLHLVHRSPRQD